MPKRLYKFNWKFIGDIDKGRPTLGNSTRLEMFRLFQYTLRDVLEVKIGTRQADVVIYKAGFLAGTEFCKQYLQLSLSLEDFLQQLKEKLSEFGVGLLEYEKLDSGDSGKNCLQLTVREDLNCSGLPDIQHAACSYDEGFIAGILKAYTGGDFMVKEVACWCLGNEYCRFEVELL